MVLLKIFFLFLYLAYTFVAADSLDERVKLLEKSLGIQSKEIEKLTAENKELKARIFLLEDDQGFASEDKIVKNDAYSNNVKHTVDSSTSDYNKTAPEVGNRYYNKRQTEYAAFHVYLSANRCFQDKQIIEFNAEELDIGNGYNSNDGIYVVPVGGIYVFTWTYLANNDEWAETEIVVNGTPKEWTISDSPSGFSIWSPASNLVVVQVNTGDHVFIRRITGRGCTTIGGHGYTRSNFSGWMLMAQ